MSVYLDMYGLRFSLNGDWTEVLESLRLDFGWFEQHHPVRAELEVLIEQRSPDFDVFGELVATFVTPRSVVYQENGRTIVDYFGRVLSVFDRRGGNLVVQGLDAHFVHEAVYHFLLSSVGSHLDANGLPRLHALGLAGAQGAVAVMLPSGGGKSMLTLRSLEADGVKLLSDDTPLLDRQGRLHPFPLRIGVNPTDASSLPAGSRVRLIERMEFHPKLAVDLDPFADRIQGTPVPLRHLVIGRRSLGHDARLESLPRRAALGTLLRDLVVGVGVPQGMEFVLQRGMRDVLRQSRPALTRSACCVAALRKAHVWRLTLGRDHERNWEALQPLLSRPGQPGRRVD